MRTLANALGVMPCFDTYLASCAGGYRCALPREWPRGDEAPAGNIAKGLSRRLLGLGVLDGIACPEVRPHHAEGRLRGILDVHRKRKGVVALTILAAVHDLENLDGW